MKLTGLRWLPTIEISGDRGIEAGDLEAAEVRLPALSGRRIGLAKASAASMVMKAATVTVR
jgi:hypothetical protein